SRAVSADPATAAIFPGPCFSNAEVLIYGDHAVLAWKVTDGSWDGTNLNGLCVAAAIEGSATFSQDDPSQARSVILVDKRANPLQREALVAMANSLEAERLSRVVT